MKDLVVKYKLMGFIPLRFRRGIPERWDELSPRQLRVIGGIFSKQPMQDADLVARFFNIPRVIIRRLDPFYVYNILYDVDFLSSYSPWHKFMIASLKGYSAPKGRLEGMSFGQFVFADTYYINYSRLHDKTLLNKLIATLYAPAGESFDEKLINARAEEMDSLPEAVKQAVLINWTLVKEWLTVSYPLVFIKPGEEDKKKPQEEEDQPAKKERKPTPSDDWVKIFDNLVSDDLVNADKYAAMPVHTVFRYITRKIKENAKRA